jgi:hypothetical protein
MQQRPRAALAGVAAAGAWAAAEPLAQRVFRTPYSDLRALGRPFSERHWRAVGLALHLLNGAAAGLAFERIGLRGWKAGVVAFEAETVATWPLMTLVDRFHPDSRSGVWPPFTRDGRVLAQELALHAIFGALLGTLVGRAHANS